MCFRFSVAPAVCVQVPGEVWAGQVSLPKLLRLAFHDCLRYDDGSGGCDGCLEWTGVGERTDRDDMKKYLLNASADGHNNGLMPTVEVLEKIYTEADFPRDTPILPRAPRDADVSRADLWAFAGMVAVEFGIELNNRACAATELRPIEVDGDANCHPRVGEADCEVVAPRPFFFATGRIDCTPEGVWDHPYQTSKIEVHPDAGGTGADTLAFFKKWFDFNGRETVTILGAHTLGRVHNTISLHQCMPAPFPAPSPLCHR